MRYTDTYVPYFSKKKCTVSKCNRCIVGVWSPIGRQELAIPACDYHFTLHRNTKSKFNFWRIIGETPPSEDKDYQLIKDITTRQKDSDLGGILAIKKKPKKAGVYASLCILFEEKGPSKVTHKQAAAIAKEAKCDCLLSKGHFKWYLKKYKDSLKKGKAK